MKNAIFLILVSFVAQIAEADVWAERKELSKIESEISALESLVMTAKARSTKSNRTLFEYQVLLDDLRKIRGGIANHLTVPMEPIVPSSFDLLTGNYTEHQQ